MIATGPLAPTPAPTTGAPSPIAPTGPTAGIPNFVERKLGADITQTDGVALVVRVESTRYCDITRISCALHLRTSGGLLSSAAATTS